MASGYQSVRNQEMGSSSVGFINLVISSYLFASDTTDDYTDDDDAEFNLCVDSLDFSGRSSTLLQRSEARPAMAYPTVLRVSISLYTVTSTY